MLTLLHNLEFSLVSSFTAAAASSVFVLAEFVAVKLQAFEAFAQWLLISSYIVLETKTEVTQKKNVNQQLKQIFFLFFFHSFIGYPSYNIQYKFLIQQKKKNKEKK